MPYFFWSGDRSPSVTSPADKKLKRTKKDIEIQIAWAASVIPIHKLKHGLWNWGKSKLKPNNCYESSASLFSHWSRLSKAIRFKNIKVLNIKASQLYYINLKQIS